MDKKGDIKTISTLDGLTCIDSAEGMARRVLSDLKTCGLTKDELAAAYKRDYLDGGYQYPNLISLGELLGDLATMSQSIQKE